MLNKAGSHCKTRWFAKKVTTTFYILLHKLGFTKTEKNAHVEIVGCSPTGEKSLHCGLSLDLFIVVRNIPFFSIPLVLPLPVLSFLAEELRDGTASPLRGLVLHQYP